jgi:hypothetical protein
MNQPNTFTQITQPGTQLPQGFPTTSNTKNNIDIDIDEITEGIKKMRVEFNEVSKQLKEAKNLNKSVRYENNRRDYNDKREVKCYNCGRNGHIARDCRSPPSRPYNNRYDNNRQDYRRNDDRNNDRNERTERTERRVNFNNSRRNRSSSRSRDLNY